MSIESETQSYIALFDITTALAERDSLTEEYLEAEIVLCGAYRQKWCEQTAQDTGEVDVAITQHTEVTEAIGDRLWAANQRVIAAKEAFETLRSVDQNCRII